MKRTKSARVETLVSVAYFDSSVRVEKALAPGIANAWLSPEAFLYMAGQDAPLGPKLDTFAFGALIHRVWTGDLPGFDHAKYTYLYEAALDGGDIALSPTLPVKLRDVVLRMLDPKPDNRPEDAEVTNLLSISPEDARPPQDARPLNGLSRFMKPAP